MRISVIFTLTCALLAVTGCDMFIPPWQAAKVKATAARPVTCIAGADCDQKWARAQWWVKQNTSQAIITHNDSIIATSPSMEGNIDSAITITKVKGSEPDTYNLTFAAECGNILGCVPPVLKLKANFVSFMETDAYLNK